MLEIAPMKQSAADLALPAEALVANGVQLSLAGEQARFSLRARDAAVLEGLLDRKLPAKIGETLDGVACLGPDEWYASLTAGTMLPLGEGLPVSVTEVSSRALGFVVEGPRAVELITSGCPLDVAKFPIGQDDPSHEGARVVPRRDEPERRYLRLLPKAAAVLVTELLHVLVDDLADV